MENTKVNLINEVSGSIVSNEMVKSIDTKVNSMEEAQRRIGQLEGELKLADHLIDQQADDYERQLSDQSETISVTINESTEKVIRDHWGNIVDNFKIVNTIDTKRLKKTEVGQLLDAGVKAQAAKDVEAAEEKVKEAKATADKANKSAKRADEMAKSAIESYRKEEQTNLDKAERRNLKEIASLKLQVKALEKEGDLLLDEKDQLAQERDLALEAQSAELNLLKNKIDMLERPQKDIIDAIRSRINGWRFDRKLRRLS